MKKDCGSAGTILIETLFQVNARRLIVWIYAALFLLVGGFSGTFFFRTYREYAQLQRVEAETRQRLAQAEERLKRQERVLERLRTDPAYVEKVIRRQMLYARPDEFLFRFEDDDQAGRGNAGRGE
jgi:cell division protein DivIC